MICYTYIILALAIAGNVRAADEAAAAGESGAPEPYSYGYEAPDHAAAEERKPDGTVQGYYTLKDADGRSRRVNYVADESGFHANVETNEHGTKTSNPADAQILATPANAEQLVYYQQNYQQSPQVQVAQQVQTVQPQRLQQQVQYAYQPGYTTQYGSAYGYGQQLAYPGSATGAYGYAYYPSSSSGYYQSGYYPGSAYYGNNQAYNYQTGYGIPSYTTTGATYGTANSAVYGGYNTPGGYFSTVRSSLVKPAVVGVRQVVAGSVPSSASVYRTVSSNSVVRSSPVLGGSSNYSIIQKRDVEAPKQAQPSTQEKATPEKPGQEKKTSN